VPAADFTYWLELGVVAVLTSVVSGVMGMAGGMLLLAVMLLRLEPAVAIPVHGVVQLVSNASRAFFLRRQVRWDAVWRFAWHLAIGLRADQRQSHRDRHVRAGFDVVAVVLLDRQG
jgi:uncharacterized membrane protein YfcA